MWGSNVVGSSGLVLDDIKCWVARWDLISLLCSLHGVLSCKHVSILTHDPYMTPGMRLRCPFRGLEMVDQQRGFLFQTREAGDQNAARGSSSRMARTGAVSVVVQWLQARSYPISPLGGGTNGRPEQRACPSHDPPGRHRPFVHLHRRRVDPALASLLDKRSGLEALCFVSAYTVFRAIFDPFSFSPGRNVPA